MKCEGHEERFLTPISQGYGWGEESVVYALLTGLPIQDWQVMGGTSDWTSVMVPASSVSVHSPICCLVVRSLGIHVQHFKIQITLHLDPNTGIFYSFHYVYVNTEKLSVGLPVGETSGQ